MFSFIFAAILCGLFPFGTVLGVFTIIVLSKDSVKKIYELAEKIFSNKKNHYCI